MKKSNLIRVTVFSVFAFSNIFMMCENQSAEDPEPKVDYCQQFNDQVDKLLALDVDSKAQCETWKKEFAKSYNLAKKCDTFSSADIADLKASNDGAQSIDCSVFSYVKVENFLKELNAFSKSQKITRVH